MREFKRYNSWGDRGLEPSRVREKGEKMRRGRERNK